MTFDDLESEYRSDLVGPAIWALVVELAGAVCRKYPPPVYNAGHPWDASEIEDLAQEVVLERLLGEGQLDYVFNQAVAAPDQLVTLRRLLVFQIRRGLSHRRRKTAADRVFERVERRAHKPHFRCVDGVLGWAVMRDEGTYPDRLCTPAEIVGGHAVVGEIPRIPTRVDAARESMIYTAAQIEELLDLLCEEFISIALSDVRKILDSVLTSWDPTFLVLDELDSAAVDERSSSAEREDMTRMVREFVQGLEPVARVVLVGKSQGISDATLAGRLGRSRPWIADRKAEILGRVEAELLADVPAGLHDEAVSVLLEACGAEGGL